MADSDLGLAFVIPGSQMKREYLGMYFWHRVSTWPE